MKGWEVNKLGEVCDLVARGVAPKYLETGGARVVNQKCVRDHAINFDLARRHDHKAKAVPKDRYIRAGDVLVNSTGTGTLGRVAQVRQEPDEPTTVDTHVTIVRPQAARFYPDFFGYMLIKIEDEIAASGEGASGQTELARSTLTDKFLVSFPKSLDEQRRIVAILDEAFAGLAMKRQHAEANLKNARALFDSHLNAIFSQSGEGWVEDTIGNCFKLSSGQNLTSKSMVDGQFPVFGGNGIAGMHNEFNLSGDNVVIGRVGALCGNVRNVTDRIWLTDNAFRVVDPRYKFDNRFLTYLLNFKNLRSLARQSAQPVISNSSLKDVVLTFPESAKAQNDVGVQLDTLLSETTRLESLYRQKLAAIDELKQSILHRAFSGQLTGEAIAA